MSTTAKADTGAKNEAHALEALDKASAAIGKHEAERSITVPNLGELCKVYKTIKPFVQSALPLVQAIPVYGAKIASVLSFLLKVADLACP